MMLDDQLILSLRTCVKVLFYLKQYSLFIFLDAVRHNRLTGGRATDAVVHKAIIKWPQFACDRDGGRQRRSGATSVPLNDIA